VTLLFEVLGVVVGGLALAALLTGRAGGSAGQGVAMVVVAAASVLFWTQVWPGSRALLDQRKAHANIAEKDALRAGAGDINNGFLDWARSQMRSAETFSFAPAQPRSGFLYQWATYQLLPHRHTDAAKADWLMLYGANPRDVPYDHRRFGRALTFGPGFSLIRRTGAR
jgi:hypothetical protein